jgi:hypothetical protein
MNNLRNRSVPAVRFASLWVTVLTLLAACGGGGSGVASDPSDPNTTSTPPDTTAPVVTITGPTSLATHATGTTPLTLSGTASDAVRHASQLGERSGRVGDGHRDDELECERDSARERCERADGDGARCSKQHQHRYADGDDVDAAGRLRRCPGNRRKSKATVFWHLLQN